MKRIIYTSQQQIICFDHLYHGTKNYSALCDILDNGLKDIKHTGIVCLTTTKVMATGYGSFIVRVDTRDLDILELNHNPTNEEIRSSYGAYDAVKYDSAVYVINIDKLNEAKRQAVLYDDELCAAFGLSKDTSYNTSETLENTITISSYDIDTVLLADVSTNHFIGVVDIIDIPSHTIPCILNFTMNSIQVVPYDLLEYNQKNSYIVTKSINIGKHIHRFGS